MTLVRDILLNVVRVAAVETGKSKSMKTFLTTVIAFIGILAVAPESQARDRDRYDRGGRHSYYSRHSSHGHNYYRTYHGHSHYYSSPHYYRPDRCYTERRHYFRPSSISFAFGF